MHRIDHPTAVAERFVEEDTQLGQPATVVTARWANAVQEELASVIESAGITLNDADDTQLAQAIETIVAAHETDTVVQNGNFNFWQRGESFKFDGTARSNLKDYCADRWSVERFSGEPTLSREVHNTAAEVPGSRYYLRWEQGPIPSVGNPSLSQQIEGVRTLSGTPATLSFWARLNGAPPQSIIPRLTQNFGTGGSPSADVSFLLQATPILDANWQKVVVKTFVPSIVGKTIGTDQGTDFLELSLLLPPSKDGFFFDLDQIKLEPGNVATGFTPLPPSAELAQLQRYFWTTYEDGVAPGETDDVAFPNRDAGMIERRIFLDASEGPPSTCLQPLQIQLPIPMRGSGAEVQRSWWGDAGAEELLTLRRVSSFATASSFPITSIEHAGQRSTGAPCSNATHNAGNLGQLNWTRAHVAIDAEFKG